MNSKANIIIIDDEKSIRETLKRFLLNSGYHVEVAPDLTSARQLINFMTFDVAVVDRMLPDGEDGVDFLDEIKSKIPFCQVIMISAYPSYISMAKSVAGHAQSYLEKPVEKAFFLKEIEKALIAANKTRANPSAN